MAIYDLGTASLSASGEVTGVGTTWKAPLTLIRVGATIVFKTEPVKIYTISEIISDTQINVYNPNSEVVPAGTGYAILAHDGITVQGLAQDVAETLRYYQSKETSIESLIEIIENSDIDVIDGKIQEMQQILSSTMAAEASAKSSSDSALEYSNESISSSNESKSARDEAVAAKNSTIEAINNAGDAGTLVTLAHSTGASLIGTADGVTVQEAITNINSELSSVSGLRGDLASIDGSSLIYLPSYDDLRSYSGTATYLYVRGRSAGTTLACGWFGISPGDTTTPDDDGTILVDALNRRWVRIFNGVLLPEWFGADPSGASDCTSAFNKCFASAKGKEVMLGGKYKFLNPIVVDYGDQYSLKLSGTGSSNHKSGAKIDNYCYLDFDDIPEGSRALTFKGVRGLTLKDFHISHRKVSSSVSIALWITQLDNFKIDGVTIDSNSGPSGQGIRFGESSGEDCAFMGSVSNCKVWMHGGGPAFAVQPLCTSITLKNCYQIGGYYYFQGCIYMSMLSCASEGSQVNGYGYVLYSVKGLTAINCAGEGNKNGVFYISNGTSNVEILSPFGSGNNSGNTAIPGALVYVDGSGGFNANIHIDNPVSENQGSNTVSDIGFSSSNKNMSVTNVYAQNLSKGIGGSDSWAASNLSVSGDLSHRSFTFTTSGFTVQSPVMSGRYVRNGKRLDFTLSLSGSSAITTTLGASLLQLPFGSLVADTVCSVASNTGTNFGNAVISSIGNVYLPTTSGATGFVISGSIITE